MGKVRGGEGGEERFSNMQNYRYLLAKIMFVPK